MKKKEYLTDLDAKLIAAAVVLITGVGVAAYAQSPSPPPLPSLAALPSIPQPSSAPVPEVQPPSTTDAAAAKEAAAKTDTAEPTAEEKAESKKAHPPGSVQVTPSMLKKLDTPEARAAGEAARKKAANEVKPSPLAELPLPTPESSDLASQLAKSNSAVAAPGAPVAVATAEPSAIPGLDPIAIPTLEAPPQQAGGNIPVPPGIMAIPAPAKLSDITGTKTLPEVTVKDEKPKAKTWETKLATVPTGRETAFNYRRDLLPSSIYSTTYTHENAHLPRAVTRQDYTNLLFASVVRNDVETTRALLNAGTDINARLESGETPLAAARRSGAFATAKLLEARGGQ